MTKVITYGTYDLLHYGHIRLLERAKALGDYLIVGVTADDFDKVRGKINVQQSLMERVEAVRATGIADEIIIEEYEGQKIDDIRRYDIDIFTVGSDWVGHFDYLNEYCKVVYLERTQGVSSSEIRAEKRKVKLGLVGESPIVMKFARECEFVNGLEISCIYSSNNKSETIQAASNYEELLNNVDAVYIASEPAKHYQDIKSALHKGKHVLCETPIALSKSEKNELHELARANNCILMDSIKTAYSTAYSRLLLLIKGGKIGKVVSVDATATSLRDIEVADNENVWNSINEWGPTVMLPVFQVLGTDYNQKKIVSQIIDEGRSFDSFTKIDFVYDDAVATVKVGKGVKSEGELIISGTKGYIYVPAPWWITDYFEIRYEDTTTNKRYFYQLDGEGIRYELVAFLKAIETGKYKGYISRKESDAICEVIEDFYNRKDFIELK
ncbi:glycerol-3-phosphate cytidylyltransferase [Enterococcus cecorum]|uniref:Gfo/Idh/MocA family oxidoreductase n=1 Tax=Enterococcus cecorum TaxID=44008 RepID=UPI000DEBCF4C|nr:Gfo/Idh/MocA family oxidoreductase [Enterococcus cecorum]RBR27788.1 glycerol-3-phosphate cytidylyltransferase [Enterococcus cecorum]